MGSYSSYSRLVGLADLYLESAGGLGETSLVAAKASSRSAAAVPRRSLWLRLWQVDTDSKSAVEALHVVPLAFLGLS